MIFYFSLYLKQSIEYGYKETIGVTVQLHIITFYIVNKEKMLYGP